MTEDLDDLTIDGTNLLEELAARSTDDPELTRGELTITELTITERWAPSVALPSPEANDRRQAGFSRLQVGIIVGTFMLGALVGLAIGLSRAASDTSAAQPADAQVGE